jgi:hypothetical protein
MHHHARKARQHPDAMFEPACKPECALTDFQFAPLLTPAFSARIGHIQNRRIIQAIRCKSNGLFCLPRHGSSSHRSRDHPFSEISIEIKPSCCNRTAAQRESDSRRATQDLSSSEGERQMNRPRPQVIVFITMTLGVVAACSNNTPTETDPYAVPAPPPAAPYSEDVRANATAVAANATAQAAYANAVNALEKAHDAAVKGTAVARATDRALETRGTEIALMATSTAVVMQATLQASSVQATAEAERINQQATVQAQTLLVQATGIALTATGTAVAIQGNQERAAAEWENNVVMPAKKVGIVIFMVLLLIALASFGVRLFDALILRVRIIRDPSGHAIILPEPDKQGRQTMLLPNRTPGPVLQLAPPDMKPQQVVVDGTDADVTQRAQVIEAMSISQGQVQQQPVQRVLGDAVIVPQLGSLTQPTVVRLIPTEQLPPAQIADGLAIEAIDADWRRADE